MEYAATVRWLLAIAILVSACGGTVERSTPAPAATSSAAAAVNLATAGPTPTEVPSPSPTPDPEAVRKTAAAAYLVAAESANKAYKALDSKYKTFGTLTRARAYYKAAATIEGDFIAKVKKIIVPADTAADLHALIAKSAATQALDIEGSGAQSWSDVDSVIAALEKAARATTAAANLIRSDLGLPPIHN